MALRTIRELGDEVLEKECREIKQMTPRLRSLAKDMEDTMYAANGVGLAAPQVGVLRQLIVIDVGDGPIYLVNPVIVEQDGEQFGSEGCLSYPGKAGNVRRPSHVIVKALDLSMNPIEVEGEDLLARCLCHEIDHLHGIMYTTRVEGEIYDAGTLAEEEEEDEEEDEEEGAFGEDDEQNGWRVMSHPDSRKQEGN